MKTATLVLMTVLISLPIVADVSSGSESVIVVARSEPRAVATSLTMPADFVSVPIRVTSEQKDTALSYEESRTAIDLITEKAAETNRIQVRPGVVELTQHRKYFGISSGSWSQPAAAADLYLLVPLDKETGDLFTAGAEAARFVESIALPGKVRCELGELQLAVENPEQYRTRLLKLIKQLWADTRDALEGYERRIEIEGLESPVHVRQVNAKEVELYLDYTMRFSSGG